MDEASCERVGEEAQAAAEAAAARDGAVPRGVLIGGDEAQMAPRVAGSDTGAEAQVATRGAPIADIEAQMGAVQNAATISDGVAQDISVADIEAQAEQIVAEAKEIKSEPADDPLELREIYVAVCDMWAVHEGALAATMDIASAVFVNLEDIDVGGVVGRIADSDPTHGASIHVVLMNNRWPESLVRAILGSKQVKSALIVQRNGALSIYEDTIDDSRLAYVLPEELGKISFRRKGYIPATVSGHVLLEMSETLRKGADRREAEDARHFCVALRAETMLAAGAYKIVDDMCRRWQDILYIERMQNYGKFVVQFVDEISERRVRAAIWHKVVIDGDNDRKVEHLIPAVCGFEFARHTIGAATRLVGTGAVILFGIDSASSNRFTCFGKHADRILRALFDVEPQVDADTGDVYVEITPDQLAAFLKSAVERPAAAAESAGRVRELAGEATGRAGEVVVPLDLIPGKLNTDDSLSSTQKQ